MLTMPERIRKGIERVRKDRPLIVKARIFDKGMNRYGRILMLGGEMSLVKWEELEAEAGIPPTAYIPNVHLKCVDEQED